MLEGGTKVIITTDFFHPMLCKEGSLRLAKAALKEKLTEVKSADSENGEPKKPKKKSSKSRKEMIQNFRCQKMKIQQGVLMFRLFDLWQSPFRLLHGIK